MVDTKALLKTFGQGVNAAQQIATDKAVNARRRRPASYSRFDITDGQLVISVIPQTGTPYSVNHQLGRTPTVVFMGQPAPNVVIGQPTASTVPVVSGGSPGDTITLWVV